MKTNWIYVFKLFSEPRPFEGVYVATINGWHIFDGLPFICSGACPRLVLGTDVDWAKPVMANSDQSIEAEYRAELTKASQ